jgi:hypothetical protein
MIGNIPAKTAVHNHWYTQEYAGLPDKPINSPLRSCQTDISSNDLMRYAG